VKHDLHTVGEALFGNQWRCPLARALGVSERTMRYWAAGQFTDAIPWDEIAALCRVRDLALTTLAKQLTRLSE
jgi:hypothetical protein